MSQSLIKEIHCKQTKIPVVTSSNDGHPEFSVGFTSTDIQQLHQYLIKQGVVVDDMQEDNEHYLFHLFDPSGNKLQAHW
jgi:kynureninase